MSFLNLGLLPYFLPLAAIPIVLHLLTLHRLRTVELSTFRFLFDSYVQQRRRMKFLEALIASLRVLFLLFLVFMFARPVVRHWSALFGSGSGREIVLMMDCSASMNASSTGDSSLNRAKVAALAVADRLGASDRVTLIRVGAQPEELFRRFSGDSKAIRAQIEGLKSTPSRANLFAAFSHLFSNDSTEMTRPIVHLFTDCQKSGWRELEDQLAKNLIPDQTELVVINVGSNQEIPNRAVIGDAPDRVRSIVGMPVVLRPRVVNHSTTEPADVTASVFVDDKEVARASMRLKPGDSGKTEIVFTPQRPGVFRCRYEIPADRFTDDDTFLFTLVVEPQARIVLINGSPSAEQFEDECLYLRTALGILNHADQPVAIGGDKKAADGTPTSAADKEFVRSLEIHEIEQKQLNPDSLKDTKVVVLANCGTLNTQQFAWIRDYVNGGGGLIVFPGDKVNPQTYNKSFFPVPDVPGKRLINVELAAAKGDINKPEDTLLLSDVDYAHPVLRVFDESTAQHLTEIRVRRRFPIKVPKGAKASRPLIDLSDKSPAIVESRLGAGRVLLSAFPANSKWTNLPLRGEFVPLILRMVSYVMHRPEFEGPAVVPAGGIAEFTLASHWGAASGKVIHVSGGSSDVKFQRSESRLLGAFKRTEEKGYYRVRVRGGTAQQPKNDTLSFAVNLAAGESEFKSVDEVELAALLPKVKVKLIDASAEAQMAHGSIGNEREIWRPLILLLFVIIGIEFLLSTLSGAALDEESEPQTVSERIRQMTPGAWVGRMTGAGEVEAEREPEEIMN